MRLLPDLTNTMVVKGRVIKSIAICCYFLFFFAMTTSAFAVGPVQLTWTPQTIPAFGGGGNVDVFGLLYTEDGGTCSSGCLWANARYEANTQYGRTYVATNISSPTWQGCDSPYSAHIAGIFGRDRTSSTAVTAYIPNGPVSSANGGVTDMSYISGICASNNNLNTTQSNEAAGFLKTSASDAYYINVNGDTGANSDSVMVTTTGGSSWTNTTLSGIPNNTTINDIDGDNTAGKVFIATSNGLYECSGGNYPACSTWTLAAFSGTSLNKVLYKYDYLQGSTGTQLLVVGSDSGASIGKYDSGGSIAWSLLIVPQFGATNAPIITGIAADQNYVYISSYGYTAAAGMTKAEALKKYSPRNLISSGCNQRSELLQGLTDGGVTVYTTQWNGVTANMNKFLSYDSSNFYSSAVLGVSLQIDPTTNYATRIFVPSLAPVCDEGGYSVGQFNTSYADLQCYPSGDTPPCSSPDDIGTVFHVYSSGKHGLIAALADYSSSTEIEWGAKGTQTDAVGNGVGEGRANTDLIVTILGNNSGTDYAAKTACADFSASVSGITYTDWFLPSGDGGELDEMYNDKSTIGGFDTVKYWSSTEEDSDKAWAQDFNNGNQNDRGKNKTELVRCIRAF